MLVLGRLRGCFLLSGYLFLGSMKEAPGYFLGRRRG